MFSEISDQYVQSLSRFVYLLCPRNILYSQTSKKSNP